MPTGEIISAHYDWDVELSGWWEGEENNKAYYFKRTLACILK